MKSALVKSALVNSALVKSALPGVDAGAWARFLQDEKTRDPATGLWWSWVSADGSAYPYEEATAWALLAGATDERARDALRAITMQRPAQRAGRAYLFDTAVTWDAALTLGDTAWAEAAWRHVAAMMAALRLLF